MSTNEQAPKDGAEEQKPKNNEAKIINIRDERRKELIKLVLKNTKPF